MPKSLDRGPEHPWPTHFEREKVLSETKIEKGKNDFFLEEWEKQGRIAMKRYNNPYQGRLMQCCS